VWNLRFLDWYAQLLHLALVVLGFGGVDLEGPHRALLVHDWPALHIQTVGQFLATLHTPGVRVTRKNLRSTLSALAD
jgi:hypothetical protein